MKKFIVEREIDGIGEMTECELQGAAGAANEASTQVGTIQWIHSYIANDRTFCIYLAPSIDEIKRHAQLAGLPANRIVEITNMADPTTAA